MELRQLKQNMSLKDQKMIQNTRGALTEQFPNVENEKIEETVISNFFLTHDNKEYFNDYIKFILKHITNGNVDNIFDMINNDNIIENLKCLYIIYEVEGKIDGNDIEYLLNHEMICEKYLENKITKNVDADIPDGQFTCNQCKRNGRPCKKTTYTQAQTRSADEPMQTFVTCLVCNHRFNF